MNTWEYGAPSAWISAWLRYDRLVRNIESGGVPGAVSLALDTVAVVSATAGTITGSFVLDIVSGTGFTIGASKGASIKRSGILVGSVLDASAPRFLSFSIDKDMVSDKLDISYRDKIR